MDELDESSLVTCSPDGREIDRGSWLEQVLILVRRHCFQNCWRRTKVHPKV